MLDNIHEIEAVQYYLTTYQGEHFQHSIEPVDSLGNPLDLSGTTANMIVYNNSKYNLQTGSGLTTDYGKVTLDIPATNNTGPTGSYKYRIEFANSSGDSAEEYKTLIHGNFTIL